MVLAGVELRCSDGRRAVHEGGHVGWCDGGGGNRHLVVGGVGGEGDVVTSGNLEGVRLPVGDEGVGANLDIAEGVLVDLCPCLDGGELCLLGGSVRLVRHSVGDEVSG